MLKVRTYLDTYKIGFHHCPVISNTPILVFFLLNETKCSISENVTTTGLGPIIAKYQLHEPQNCMLHSNALDVPLF
jgi:hypothetical protein